MGKFSPTCIACLAASGLCLVALLPMPIGFYTLLRFVACASALAAGVALVQGNQARIALLAWAIAILYNPVLRVYLEREVWIVLNLLSAMGLVVMARRVHVLDNGKDQAESSGDTAVR